MDFWDVLDARHSTRDFRPDPIPRKVLERMIHAAATAPSSMNSQPWRFHITTGARRAELGKIVAQATVHLEEYLDHLGPERYEQAVQWYSSLGDAPVVIGVSMQAPDSDIDQVNKLLSVGASIENLMLAATAQGLGTCSITFTSWVRDELGELFGLADDRAVVAIIAVGFQSEIPVVAPRHRADIMDWLE